MNWLRLSFNESIGFLIPWGISYLDSGSLNRDEYTFYGKPTICFVFSSSRLRWIPVDVTRINPFETIVDPFKPAYPCLPYSGLPPLNCKTKSSSNENITWGLAIYISRMRILLEFLKRGIKAESRVRNGQEENVKS